MKYVIMLIKMVTETTKVVVLAMINSYFTVNHKRLYTTTTTATAAAAASVMFAITVSTFPDYLQRLHTVRRLLLYLLVLTIKYYNDIVLSIIITAVGTFITVSLSITTTFIIQSQHQY